MSLAAGTKLGPYEILAPIGAGGMGEVYRARDTRLKRDVALKVLPEAFASDPNRMMRFQREAEVLASLNHPNIAHIFSVADEGSARALAMELVEGESPRGPMPFDEAWKIALQIADALAYAHEKGVVHRDLKPANIKVTPDGVVKLLDFGLAKAFSGTPDSISADPANSPTVTMGATAVGVILGTAAYMSPEQARGKSVDRRADIWAFGVVLYELLTGKQLFRGEDLTDILASVVKEHPDLSAAPEQAQRVLQACLEKDPKKRLQAIGDVQYLVGGTAALVAAPSRSRFSAAGWVAAVVLALGVIPLAVLSYRHSSEEVPRVVRFTVPPPEQGTFEMAGLPQLSPDGRHIAYIARVQGGPPQLWVRDLDSLTPRAVVKETSRFPFWSPDGRSIGFGSGGKLLKVDADGGPALTLCDAPNLLGGTWNRDDVLLFSPVGSGPILRVPAAGGSATPVTTLDQASGESGHTFPWFLPDGRHFLYTADSSDEDKTAIYVADLQSKESRARVMIAKSNAVYVPPGYLLFLREHILMALPFDAGKLRATGEAFPVAEQVDSNAGPARGYFSASQNGVLAFTSGAQAQNVQMTWFDRSGKTMGTVGPPVDMEWPAISPDGKTVAIDRRDPQTGNYDIWLRDLARGNDSRFTFNPNDDQFPVWSPDGGYLAFLSDRGGQSSVYKKATGGVGRDEIVDKDELIKRPTDWSPDGRLVIEDSSSATPRTSSDIWIAPASPGAGGEKPRPYLQTEFQEGTAKLSPNGKWLAYHSDETKRSEVYIMTFPNPGGKWQISTSGGSIPVWSRDGKQLFYISGTKMMAVEINGAGANPEPGVPQPLFDVRLGANNPSFDVSKDGRFLIPTAVEQAAAAPITVVVNWMAGLKK
jgi:Tol biopolymer transport system component